MGHPPSGTDVGRLPAWPNCRLRSGATGLAMEASVLGHVPIVNQGAPLRLAQGRLWTYQGTPWTHLRGP